MSAIYRCDICGKEMERTNNRIILIKNEVKMGNGAQSATLYTDERPEYDLCSDCYKNIKEELENIKKYGIEPCYSCKHYKTSSRDSFPCSECNKNYISQYEHK